MQILWTLKTAAYQYNQNKWVQNGVKRNIFLFEEEKKSKQNRTSIIAGWEEVGYEKKEQRVIQQKLSITFYKREIKVLLISTNYF